MELVTLRRIGFFFFFFFTLESKFIEWSSRAGEQYQVNPFLFLFLRPLFLWQFQVHNDIRRVQRFPKYPSPTPAKPPLLSAAPPDGTFVTVDDPALTHHGHSKSIDSLRWIWTHLLWKALVFSIATTCVALQQQNSTSPPRSLQRSQFPRQRATWHRGVSVLVLAWLLPFHCHEHRAIFSTQ